MKDSAVNHAMSTDLLAATTSRRRFLGASAAGLATASTVAVTGLGTQLVLAPAAGAQTGDVLVVVFLRGGADGLSMAPPYGYDSYRRLRPTIAVNPPGEANGALPLTSASANGNASFPSGIEGVLGLHPAMKPLYDALWTQGKLAVIPAIGLPPSESASRSHFTATRYMQVGSAAANVGGGWLGRMLNQTGASGAVPAVDTSTRSELLNGGNGAVAIPSLRDFGIDGFKDRDGARNALRVLHKGTDSVSAQGKTVLDVVDRIDALPGQLRPGYNKKGKLGRTFSELSSLIGSGLGVRAASVDSGGWDQHANHGPVGNGRFHTTTTELADALAAFSNDTNGLQGITVLVITEFGRTINENGNKGTDHGRATTYLAMGSGIRGGVYGDDYPDVIADDPQYGDLSVLTDFRKPMAEIINRRVGVGNLGTIFPGYQHAGDLGITRA